ncbi:hypothetical protein GF354_04545 [Candidatus Peregrinibacteria bacterium]|nr:hypothetical protein [Candidatus Peregrinibacteria bacterium]
MNFSLISVSVVIIFLSTNIFAKEQRTNSIGASVFNSYTFWENSYSKEKFDNLGIATFISPSFKMKLKDFYFKFDFTSSHFNFIGPDGLTITGPDNDIDTGFDSNMRRNALGLETGYNFFNYVNLSIKSNYIYMHIKGDNDQKFNWQTPFSFVEKGTIIGPGISLNFPKDNSKSYIILSMFYLQGRLNYTYDGHRSAKYKENKDYFDTQLLSANLRFNIHLNANLLFHVSLKSDYFYKEKQEQNYKYSSDIWFVGLNTGMMYLF